MSLKTLVTDFFPAIIQCKVPEIEKVICNGGNEILDKTMDDDRIKIGIKAVFYAFEDKQLHLVQFILDLANQIALCWADSKHGEYEYVFNLLYEKKIPNSEMIKKIISSPFEDIILRAVSDAVYTSLVFLSMLGKHLEVKTLLNAGINTEITNIDVEAYSWLILTYFGSYVTPLHKNTWTSLMLASTFNNYETVEILLEAGANIEAKNEQGQTPLILACLKNHTKIVSLLLDAGANLEAKDTDGNTPLDHGIKQGHTEVVTTIKTYVSPRKKMAAYRIHRFWRDVCYNPIYVFAQRRLIQQLD